MLSKERKVGPLRAAGSAWSGFANPTKVKLGEGRAWKVASDRKSSSTEVSRQQLRRTEKSALESAAAEV